MGKNDRLSRDQKRKAKLKKREERSHKHESLAYHGKKYKTPEFIPILHRTEIGIYEADVISDRALTDDAVVSSLERLILALRGGTPALPPEQGRAPADDEPLSDVVTWNIRQNWQILAERGALPRADDLIGVLRTLLSSIEIWHWKNMNSRGYLQYLESFMKDTGVNVRKVSEEDLRKMIVLEGPVRQLGLDPTDDDEDEDEE